MTDCASIFSVMTKQTHDHEPSRANKHNVRAATAGLAIGGILVAGHFALPNKQKAPAYETRGRTEATQPYTLRPGDTLSRVVQEAYPKLTLYGPKFNAKVAELEDQLPSLDQRVTGRPVDGEVIQLDSDANMQHLLNQEGNQG